MGCSTSLLLLSKNWNNNSAERWIPSPFLLPFSALLFLFLSLSPSFFQDEGGGREPLFWAAHSVQHKGGGASFRHLVSCVIRCGIRKKFDLAKTLGSCIRRTIRFLRHQGFLPPLKKIFHLKQLSIYTPPQDQAENV